MYFYLVFVAFLSTVFVRGENLVFVEECPYVVDTKNSSGVGNTIDMFEYASGRSGNRFMTMSSYLSMGYCCRSKRVTLPAKDPYLPSMEDTFYSENNSFDFSDAVVPEEFEYLRDDPGICRPVTEDTGASAFKLEFVHEDLLVCMNRVYVRGCEKKYLGDIVDTADCPVKTNDSGDGSLVIHIRSGDIFNRKIKNTRMFGQPPLQFYILSILKKNWDNVSIITNNSWGDSNPVYSALKSLGKSGILGRNVEFFNSRSLYDDVKSMICADGVVIARSSLSFLTLAHTKANSLFIPSTCGTGTYHRKSNPNTFPTPDNTTFLVEEKPYSDVYGIEFGVSSDYSVFKGWENTDEQYVEMLVYDGISNLEKC